MALNFTRDSWELVGIVAVCVILISVWLNWRRQSHIADIEEDIKNAKISSEQAFTRIRLVNWRATLLLGIGIGLLLAAGLGLAS